MLFNNQILAENLTELPEQESLLLQLWEWSELRYAMNPEEAKLKFEEIKKELFKVLGVADISLVKTSDEENMQKQKEIEEMLKRLRESNEKIPTKI